MTFNLKPTIRLIALALVSFVSLYAIAADTKESVVIHYNSGNEEVIFLADSPRISYNGPMLKVESPSLTAERALADIAKVTIEHRSLGGITETSTNSINFSFINNEIKCTGLVEKSICYLYNSNGITVMQCEADLNGTLTSDISYLAAGVYFLSINNNNTYKIYKK